MSVGILSPYARRRSTSCFLVSFHETRYCTSLNRFGTVISLAAENFFLVSVREKFLPPCGRQMKDFLPHSHGMREGRSYDKRHDQLVRNVMRI